MVTEYVDQNREGDHICYISDLRKARLTIRHGTLPRRWTISFARSMTQQFIDSVGAVRVAEGASRTFSAEHDADVIHSSALINPSMADACVGQKVGRILDSLSARIYPAYNQEGHGW